MRANAKTLASALQEYGSVFALLKMHVYFEQQLPDVCSCTCNRYKIATGGTDNHIILWDLRPNCIAANKLVRAVVPGKAELRIALTLSASQEAFLEHVSIDVNRNALHGDRSATTPGEMRHIIFCNDSHILTTTFTRWCAIGYPWYDYSRICGK